MNVLKTKLRDTEWCEQFRAYLQERYAAENLNFLLAVENFREKSATADVASARQAAQSIIDEYLEQDAPSELNVSFQCRQECKEALEQTADDELPDARIFDDTQVSVILLIMDYYKDFCSDQSNRSAIKDAVEEPTIRPRVPDTEGDRNADGSEDDEQHGGGGGGCFQMLTQLLRAR